jgi:hypothetical protein
MQEVHIPSSLFDVILELVTRSFYLEH